MQHSEQMKTSSGADKSIHRTESNYNGDGATVDVNNEEESSMAMTVDVSHGNQDLLQHNLLMLALLVSLLTSLPTKAPG